jgi:hypothetical protein
MPSWASSRRSNRDSWGAVAAVLVAGSGKAAAHQLGLSHSTVKHHLANARSKVGATTTAQLVWFPAPRLPVAKAFSALPVERLGGHFGETAPEYFLQRARYARFILDHRWPPSTVG